ncbi:hypothetical protein DUNSADRAFT_13449 [Dunaliella salina]|uniref:Uncharacterized protein n=1 Tax=Dunaliella salina TaxID=3046 RepID=A0ABQ7G9C8_DUNSA|nr:hypothetical protein DUNSADRAFT_13449 [Dunaliella salina]|eukprot:KAF5831213.1 hypothetical protein DUNSADRAFT_13449 [Dunaliella salina]
MNSRRRPSMPEVKHMTVHMKNWLISLASNIAPDTLRKPLQQLSAHMEEVVKNPSNPEAQVDSLQSLSRRMADFIVQLLEQAGEARDPKGNLNSYLNNEFLRLTTRVFGGDTSRTGEFIWILNVLRLSGNATMHKLHAPPGSVYNQLLVTLGFTARSYEIMLEVLSRLAAII